MIGDARTAVDDCIADGTHERAKESVQAWHETVTEIGAMDDGQGGALICGNCRRCKSTIARELDVPRE